MLHLIYVIPMYTNLPHRSGLSGPLPQIIVTGYRSTTMVVWDRAVTADGAVQVTAPALYRFPGGQGPSGVAVEPGGRHIYVAMYQSRNVAVFDRAVTSEGTVLSGLRYFVAPGRPHFVAVSPDSRFVLVNFQGAGGDDGGGVYSFARDVGTGDLGRRVDYSPGWAGPWHIDMSADGRSVYTADSDSHSITSMDRDVATGVLSNFQTWRSSLWEITGVFVPPDGSQVFAAGYGSGNAGVWDRGCGNTASPSSAPSSVPTSSAPTMATLTLAPSAAPTDPPASSRPTVAPSLAPMTPAPTTTPTPSPATSQPTPSPTVYPSYAPAMSSPAEGSGPVINTGGSDANRGAASDSDSSDESSSTTAVAVIFAVAVLLISGILMATFYVIKKKTGAPASHNANLAFVNPLYDEAGGGNSANPSTHGYMDMPGGGSGGSGSPQYDMYVAPVSRIRTGCSRHAGVVGDLIGASVHGTADSWTARVPRCHDRNFGLAMFLLVQATWRRHHGGDLRVHGRVQRWWRT